LFWHVTPSHEVVVDVIEALGPGLNSPFIQIHELGTESTPKPGLAVATNSTFVKLCLDGL
jgi:hypothetical protein